MSIKRSLAWMGTAQGISFALQFAATVVLARYLTVHEAGIYAIALAIVGVLSLIQALGLQALIVREEVLTPDISTTAFTINALISVVLAFAIAMISFAGGVLLGDAGVQRVLSVLAVTPLFAIFAFLPSAILEREGRFKEIALIGAAGSITGTVTTIALAVHGFSYMSVAYGQWSNGGATTILMMVIGRRHSSIRLGFKAWRRVGDFGLQMLAVTGINSLSSRLSDVLLGRLVGLSALGLYNRASGLNGMLWANIHLLIGRVMLVDYAELHRQGVPLRERYLRTVEINTALLWPIFAGLAVLAKPFIRIVYGTIWVPAAGPLALIATASIILVAITMTWEVFAATGELRTQTRIEFIRSFVALCAFAGGCLISLEAAAAARVLDALFAFFLYRPHLNRMTGTNLADFWLIYARSASLTLLACAPAICVTLAFRLSAEIPPPFVAIAIALGVVLWGGGLLLLKHPLMVEFKNILRVRTAV